MWQACSHCAIRQVGGEAAEGLHRGVTPPGRHRHVMLGIAHINPRRMRTKDFQPRRHIHDFLPWLPSRSPRFSHILTSFSGMRRGSARWRDKKHSPQRGRARRSRGKVPPNHGSLTHRNHAREPARRRQLSIGYSCRTTSSEPCHTLYPNFKLEPSFCPGWAAAKAVNARNDRGARLSPWVDRRPMDTLSWPNSSTNFRVGALIWRPASFCVLSGLSLTFVWRIRSDTRR